MAVFPRILWITSDNFFFEQLEGRFTETIVRIHRESYNRRRYLKDHLAKIPVEDREGIEYLFSGELAFVEEGKEEEHLIRSGNVYHREGSEFVFLGKDKINGLSNTYRLACFSGSEMGENYCISERELMKDYYWIGYFF